MDAAWWTLAGWLAAFLVNLAPALMPASWAVLAAFYIGFDLPLLPLTVGAAFAGALGRLTLASLTHRTVHRVPAPYRSEAEALGTWITRDGSPAWWAFALGYFMGPFPSNAPFIAAGTGPYPAKRLAVAFALARAVSDSFWVWTAGQVAPDAIDIVKDAVTDWRVLVGQVTGVVAIALVFRLPWSRWLRRR